MKIAYDLYVPPSMHILGRLINNVGHVAIFFHPCSRSTAHREGQAYDPRDNTGVVRWHNEKDGR